MESIYVLCVVLTLKNEPVCFSVPKEKTCDGLISEWSVQADQWLRLNPKADKRHLCSCMSHKVFLRLKRPLFTVGDSERK